MCKDIDLIEAFKLQNSVWVDVRSPKEYELDTIPGAINLALFDNDERSEIGQAYNERGAHEARRLGLAILVPKMLDYIEALIAHKKDKQLVLFCWRGGERSKVAGSLLELMHIPAYRIRGGYRAYRQYVNHQLHETELPYSFVVISGLTGTGKTKIIKELGRRGHPVLDLEGLANHRGSVFGGVGLGDQPSQKSFESAIWARIKICTASGFLIVEGESKKIGKLYVPEAVYNGIIKGTKILVEDTLPHRVDRLIADYTKGSCGDLEAVDASLNYLGRELGKTKIAQLHSLLQSGNLKEAGKVLLQEYYDVLYKKSLPKGEKYDLIVSGTNLSLAIQEIEAYIEHLF